MSTTATAYKHLTPTQKARYDFTYELMRHHGVRVTPSGTESSHVIPRDPETSVVLRFGSGRLLMVLVKFGREAAQEIARFDDFSFAMFAVCTYVASVVEL